MQFYYGIEGNYVNVTDLIFKYCVKEEFLFLPPGDLARAAIFGDPMAGILKHIKWTNALGRDTLISAEKCFILHIPTEETNLDFNFQEFWKKCGKFIEDVKIKLGILHCFLRLDYGSFSEEYPEQLMTIKYLKENSKVLEIGGNIGRNSCVIASILQNDSHLVTLESHPGIFQQLKHNRDLNHLHFHIENAALSKVPLIQRGWDTKKREEESVSEGWIAISTISFEELEKKYDCTFDTMVLDCEGAFYQILRDDPDCLKNIHTVILENDFTDLSHKTYVDETLRKYGLEAVYSAPGGWSRAAPCFDFFYQVFQKTL